MAAGVIEANRTGGTVKRMHCGWAAHAGVAAAELVAHGFTGPPTVLEGRFGFFQAWLHGRWQRRRGHRRARRDLVGPRDLLQALPGQPLHARRDRRGRALARAGHPPRRRRTPRCSAYPLPTCARSASRSRSSARPRPATWPSSAARTPSRSGLLGGGGPRRSLDDYTDALAHRSPAPRPDGRRSTSSPTTDAPRSSRTSSRPCSPRTCTTAGPSSRRCSPTAAVPSGRCRSTRSAAKFHDNVAGRARPARTPTHWRRPAATCPTSRPSRR